jgi:type I restriction enzyme S subunit
MSDWVFSQLGGFVVHTKGYAFKSKDYQDKGVPIIKVKNFTADSIDLSDVDYLSFEQKDEYEKVRLNYNDVVIATVGSWLTNPNSVVGKTVKVPRNVSGSLLNQNAVRLKAKEGLDQTFLFYLLKSNSFKYYIVGTAQGSANQASITLNDIFNYEFSKPLIPEQKAIAHILGKLDDKIELNRQMNQTLEAMAQALFKSWFVDFDPVLTMHWPQVMKFQKPCSLKLKSVKNSPPWKEECPKGEVVDSSTPTPNSQHFSLPASSSARP